MTERSGANDTAAFQYVVQPTDFSDWEGLHQLLHECFGFMDGRIDPPSSLARMTPETLREKADEEILIVVYDAGELIACGYLRETEETIYLGKLAVKAGFRRQGILRSIIKLAEEIARCRGKSALELQTRIELVEPRNVQGRRVRQDRRVIACRLRPPYEHHHDEVTLDRYRNPRAGGDPEIRLQWIPVFTGISKTRG